MKRFLLYALISALSLPIFAANDIVRVSATYEYISDNSRETPEQAEQTAFTRARQKALEDKFGLDVANVTSSFVSNRDNGSASNTNVFSLGETAVRGEWIETTKEQVLEKTFMNGFWTVKVHVEGKARNHAAEKADIRFAFVRHPQDMEPPVTFRDGNDIFMRFSSPVAGYLCVYLVDEEQNAFCLLPYPHQPSGSQPIEANKEYVFFSQQYDKQAQEYTVNCQRSSEQNALYVVFSPNSIAKANDQQGGLNFKGEQLPRELKYEKLLKWLSKNQTRDPQMSVHTSIISIRK